MQFARASRHARATVQRGTAVAFDVTGDVRVRTHAFHAQSSGRMGRMNVLVVSDAPDLGAWLMRTLRADRFAVRTVPPGAALLEAVRGAPPQLAVLDGIDVHPESAQLTVAVLKDRDPAVRIVALSDASSEVDGKVIEQGIFCYLASCSRDELLRVIEAAALERHGPRLQRTESELRSDS